MTFLKRHALSIFFGVIFLLALVGQAFAGWHEFNNGQLSSGMGQLSFGRYLVSTDFAADVAENWQSEYLQFLLFLLATVWFLEVGSPESKKMDKAGMESDKDQKIGRYADDDSPTWARFGDWRTTVFSWSLALVMGTIFFLSWLAQSISGWAAYNEQQLGDMQDPMSWGSYLMGADFWSRTLQNWQSEFLAVGSMAVLSVYLRMRGSSQSKPVGSPHSATGVEG